MTWCTLTINVNNAHVILGPQKAPRNEAFFEKHFKTLVSGLSNFKFDHDIFDSHGYQQNIRNNDSRRHSRCLLLCLKTSDSEFLNNSLTHVPESLHQADASAYYSTVTCCCRIFYRHSLYCYSKSPLASICWLYASAALGASPRGLADYHTSEDR